jgi:hypothetical protein
VDGLGVVVGVGARNPRRFRVEAGLRCDLAAGVFLLRPIVRGWVDRIRVTRLKASSGASCVRASFCETNAGACGSIWEPRAVVKRRRKSVCRSTRLRVGAGRGRSGKRRDLVKEARTRQGEARCF